MGLNRSARTTAKKMGSRMGAAILDPCENHHQRGEEQHHPQEGGLAQRGGYGLTDAGFAVWGVARGFTHDLEPFGFAWLTCQTRCKVFSIRLAWLLAVDAAVIPPWFAVFRRSPTSFPLTGYHD